jgi:hypothetical protein
VVLQRIFIGPGRVLSSVVGTLVGDMGRFTVGLAGLAVAVVDEVEEKH